MRRHLAVIDPAINIAEVECFNRLVSDSPLPLTYHLPKMVGLDSLRNAEKSLAGIVLLGSASSVNDSMPWQAPFNEWLLPKLQSGVPTLGLCYGHQLLAHLFGGKVEFLFPDKHKLKGSRVVRLPANRLWGEAQDVTAMVSHCEHVSKVPGDFEVLASSEQVPVEAMAHRTLPVWGFQSHPEASVGFLKRTGIAESDLPKFQKGHALVGKFLRYVADQAT